MATVATPVAATHSTPATWRHSSGDTWHTNNLGVRFAGLAFDAFGSSRVSPTLVDQSILQLAAAGVRG
ncbi:hypothetical protein Tco_1238137 [Tanacetum coccineum]